MKLGKHQTSNIKHAEKEQTKNPWFLLEALKPCTIVCFATVHELRNQHVSIG